MFLTTWLICSIINATVVSYFQYTNPVCTKAHISSLIRNILLGPISTAGCIIFISYMMARERRIYW